MFFLVKLKRKKKYIKIVYRGKKNREKNKG